MDGAKCQPYPNTDCEGHALILKVKQGALPRNKNPGGPGGQNVKWSTHLFVITVCEL